MEPAAPVTLSICCFRYVPPDLPASAPSTERTAYLNVLNERQSRALTRFLATVSSPNDRILDDPAVLVFQQPKTLFIRLSGFADRETQGYERAIGIALLAINLGICVTLRVLIRTA